ncbi:DUF262 domain-containing protein [Halomonas sp. ATBC28]|nr:DUF262 domain-containing protein [Halomonas sp. ATBC28]
MTTVSSSLKKGVLTVRQLLEDSSLAIPEYQRPYKWTTSNINQLFADIALHKDKSAYRLGTVVFHRAPDGIDPRKINRNIVDGQQRTLSLMLAVRALINERIGSDKRNSISRKDLEKTLHTMGENMIDPVFNNLISQKNLHTNYLAVSRIVLRAEFTEELIDFLLNKCELVFFELKDISEAFQFFDSQNARGRDLEPHDLLKAFHLREFTAGEEHLKAEVVSHWESSDTKKLANLFANYLFRIRNWSRGASARYFGKEDTHLFKGVNIDRIDRYPYVEQLRMTHYGVDDYNEHHHRRMDGSRLAFPFHLDQTIINGRRFFEMIGHYQNEIVNYQHTFAVLDTKNDSLSKQKLLDLDGYASSIFETIDDYRARRRTGDVYVRSMFDCLLICYIDKFGMVEVSRAVEKAFIWAYSLRLKMQVLQLASMDNYVLQNNMFLLIREATQPTDFLSVELPVLQNIAAKRVEEIETLFQEMRYCE